MVYNSGMHKHGGFTIVELLIVIVIIAILASITVVAYNGVQTRARATEVGTAFKTVATAFRLHATDAGWTSWPGDGSLVSSGGNPAIQTLVNELAGFNRYLAQAPAVMNITSFIYDNDGDTKTDCTAPAAGTNLVMMGVAPDIAASVDAQYDDNNTGCGVIRYQSSTQYLFYTLSLSNAL